MTKDKTDMQQQTRLDPEAGPESKLEFGLQRLLEELLSLQTDDLPESWPRQTEILETVLTHLRQGNEPELELHHATLSSMLAATYTQILNAGLAAPDTAAEMRRRAHLLYDEALEIRRRHERWTEVAQTAQNKANLLLSEYEAGDASAAVRAHSLYDEALEIDRRHERWTEVAQTASNKANLLQSEYGAGDRSAAARAHTLYDEALEIDRRHERWTEVAATAQNKANLLAREYKAGDASAALRAHALYDEALEIMRLHERWTEVAQTASNKANLLAREYEAGDASAAARAHLLYDEALEIMRRHERWTEVAQTANNKANLLLSEYEAGDASAALRAHALYDEALEIRRRHERWTEVAQTAQNKANLLARKYEAGDASAAARAHLLYDEALEIRRRHERWTEVAQTAQNKANLLQSEYDAGDASAALRAHSLYDEALEIMRRHERWTEVAQTAQNKANLLAREYKAGDASAAARAHAFYDEAIQHVTFDAIPGLNLGIRRNALNLCIKAQDWPVALERAQTLQRDGFDRFTELGDMPSRRLLLKQMSQVARQGCQAALELNLPEQATACLENGRTVELGSVLREAEAGDNEHAALRVLRTNLTAAREGYTEALAQLRLMPAEQGHTAVDMAKVHLAEAHSALNGLRKELGIDRLPEPPSLERLQEALGPNAALVQFWVGDEGGGALILISGAWESLALPNLSIEAVNKLLGQWLAVYSDFKENIGSQGSFESFSEQIDALCVKLWTDLMGPLAEELKRLGLPPAHGRAAPELVLVPGGRLSFLPLHAATQEVGSDPFFCGYATRIVPSLAAFMTSQDKAKERHELNGPLVAVTNPQDDLGIVTENGKSSVRFNPAAFAFKDQLEAGKGVDLHGYRGKRDAENVATKEGLKAALARYAPSCLSFYCHGGWSPGAGDTSALVLAPELYKGKIPYAEESCGTLGNPLTAAEIRKLPLGATRLAILAGCETGMIDLEAGLDEQIGLPAATLEAGAAGALASLWPVQTTSTYAFIRAVLNDRKNREDENEDESLCQSVRRACIEVRNNPQAYSGLFQALGPGKTEHSQDEIDALKASALWAGFALFGA